jgi:renalase
MAHQNKRIAVVGAGIAGAACAHHLAQSGCTVTLFDKARGVSGRLSTRRTDMAHYDHGAQYFTAQSAVFSAQANDWQQRGVVAQWQPRVANPDSQKWFVGTPDMPAIVRDLVKNIDLHVNTRIEHIECIQHRAQSEQGEIATHPSQQAVQSPPLDVTNLASSARWQLTSDKGEVFTDFTDLIIAVPPAQAVPLIQPVASSMVGLLTSIDMLPCWTVMLTTTDSVTTALPIEAERVVDHPTLVWWARNDSKPGRVQHAGQADWVIQATADWTQTHLDTDRADVIRLICDAFWRHVGVQTLPQVQQSMAHRWLYSRRHLEPLSTQSSLWAANLRLGVCGDGLIHSRVESAYLSGLHMAQTLLGEI